MTNTNTDSSVVENIFKTKEGYKECDDCQSVLSPAAYFVKLMETIEKYICLPDSLDKLEIEQEKIDKLMNFKKEDGKSLFDSACKITNLTEKDFIEKVKDKIPEQGANIYQKAKALSLKQLKARRPDLFELKLDCDSTNKTELYLEIVNKIMKENLNSRLGLGIYALRRLASTNTKVKTYLEDHQMDYDGLHKDLSLAKELGISHEDYQSITSKDSLLGLAKTKPSIDVYLKEHSLNYEDLYEKLNLARKLGISQKDYQLITYDVLEKLATAKYPFNLPANFPLISIRAYLEKQGISLADVYKALMLDADNVAELLGVAPKDYQLITSMESSEDELKKLYKIPNDKSLKDELEKVGNFIAKTGIASDKLESLLENYNKIKGLAAAEELTIDSDTIKNLNNQALGFLHHFIRIANKLSWSFDKLLGKVLITIDNADNAFVAESLCLSPEDYQLIISTEVTESHLKEVYGVDLSQLKNSNDKFDVNKFITQTNMDYDRLERLLDCYNKIKKLTDTARLTIIDNETDSKTKIIKNLDNQALAFLHRFIRLANKLSWSFNELCDVLIAIGKDEIDADSLKQISRIKSLEEKFKKPLIEVCKLYPNASILMKESTSKEEADKANEEDANNAAESLFFLQVVKELHLKKEYGVDEPSEPFKEQSIDEFIAQTGKNRGKIERLLNNYNKIGSQSISKKAKKPLNTEIRSTINVKEQKFLHNFAQLTAKLKLLFGRLNKLIEALPSELKPKFKLKELITNVDDRVILQRIWNISDNELASLINYNDNISYETGKTRLLGVYKQVLLARLMNISIAELIQILLQLNIDKLSPDNIKYIVELNDWLSNNSITIEQLNTLVNSSAFSNQYTEQISKIHAELEKDPELKRDEKVFYNAILQCIGEGDNQLRSVNEDILTATHKFTKKHATSLQLLRLESLNKSIHNVGIIGNKAIFLGEDKTNINNKNLVEYTISEPRENVAVKTIGTKTIFFGGKKSENEEYSRKIDIYDEDTGNWSTEVTREVRDSKVRDSGARDSAAAAVVGSKVIFFGGNKSRRECSSRIDIYDDRTQQWIPPTDIKNASEARANVSVAVIGEKAIFFGGEVGQGRSSAIDIYDNETKDKTEQWKSDTASEARAHASIAVVGTKVIFFGGNKGGNQPSAKVDIYDSNTKKWTTHTISEARENASVAIVDGKAIFFGGKAGQTRSNKIDIYDAKTEKWIEVQHTASEARDMVSVAEVNKQAIFFGGSKGDQQYSKQIDIYDSATDSWKATDEISEAHEDISVAVIGTKAIFFTGKKNSRVTGQVYIYDSANYSTNDSINDFITKSWMKRIAKETEMRDGLLAEITNSTKYSGKIDIYDNTAKAWKVVDIYKPNECTSISIRNNKAILICKDSEGRKYEQTYSINLAITYDTTIEELLNNVAVFTTLKIDTEDINNITNHVDIYKLQAIWTEKQVKTLTNYKALQDAFSGNELTLSQYTEWLRYSYDKGKVTEKIAQLTNWDQKVLDKIKKIDAFKQRFSNTHHPMDSLLKIKSFMDMVEKSGIDGKVLLKLEALHDLKADDTGWKTYVDTEAELKSSLSSVDGVKEHLEDQKRNILANYMLHTYSEIKNKNMRGLYAFLLIDVEMSDCSKISPLKAGLNSLQLYIHRCMLGLEEGATVKSELTEEMWDLLDNYRKWEATKKSALYPENYLDPTLRKSATAEYKALQNTLMQGNITDEAAAHAYIKYFEDFAQLVNLQIVNTCFAKDKKTLHVIGRTQAEPYTYYYRVRDLDGEKEGSPQKWNAWEKIEMQIPVSIARIIYAFGRVFIFWLQKVEKEKDIEGLSINDSILDIHYIFKKVDGSWSAQQRLSGAIKINYKFERIIRKHLFEKDFCNKQIEYCENKKKEKIEERYVFLKRGKNEWKVVSEEEYSGDLNKWFAFTRKYEGWNMVSKEDYWKGVIESCKDRIKKLEGLINEQVKESKNVNKEFYGKLKVTVLKVEDLKEQLNNLKKERLTKLKEEVQEQIISLEKIVKYSALEQENVIMIKSMEKGFENSGTILTKSLKSERYGNSFTDTEYLSHKIGNLEETKKIIQDLYEEKKTQYVKNKEEKVKTKEQGKKDLDEEKKNLEDDKEKKEKQRRELQNIIDSIEERKKKENDLQKKVEDLKIQLDNLQQQESISDNLSEASVEKGDLKVAINHLKQRLTQSKQIAKNQAEVLTQLTNLETEATRLLGELAQGKAVETLEKEKNDLEKCYTIEQLGKEINELNYKINIRTERIEKLDKEVSSLNNEISKKGEYCAELDEQKEDDIKSVNDLLKEDDTDILLEDPIVINFIDESYKKAYTKGLEIILKFGQEFNSTNIHGNTPLHLAVIKNKTGDKTDEVRNLINKGAISIKNKAGKTPLDLAREQEVNRTVDNDGNTSIHLAVIKHKTGDKVDEVKNLINKGAISIKNKAGKTPLDLAKEHNKKDVEKLLEELSFLDKSLDKSFNGFYGVYLRELFFHIPTLIAYFFNQEQEFAKARKWYQYVLNPTKKGCDAWQFIPFKTKCENQSNNNEDCDSGELVDSLDFYKEADKKKTSYEKYVIISYVDNLIDWGDVLFSQNSWEGINQATMLYIRAWDLLGEKPKKKGKHIVKEVKNACQLLDNKTNICKIEAAVPVSIYQRNSVGANITARALDTTTYCDYFCTPENKKFIGLWERIEDRLYKIRHCLDIKGKRLELPLFQPPIDPRQLIGAVAGGSTIRLPKAQVPHYRFRYMINYAKSIADTVTQIGSELLSVLEKKDAEALTLLYNKQEGIMANLITTIKEKAIETLKEEAKALNVSLSSAKDRKSHYEQLIEKGWSSLEIAAMTVSGIAVVMKAIPAIQYGIAVGAHLIPTIFGLANGGSKPGSSAEKVGEVVASIANTLDGTANMISTSASYERRKEDWELQEVMATHDVEQVGYQIEANKINQENAEQDLKAHKESIKQIKEKEQFFRSKFTNQELYSWMKGELKSLYIRVYRLALEIAKQAESAYQYEIDNDRTFIQPGYWNSLKEGLLSGQKLKFDLEQLDKEYHDSNERRLEITKVISLKHLDPIALYYLKTKGSCKFSFTEKLFDLDFPGHYARKIKDIKITIPAVVGPYENIHASLQQTSNKVVLKREGAIDAIKYLVNPGEEERPENDLLRENWKPNQEIAISKGDQDSGLFELSFGDERYLPFEGTGAVSNWELNLPKATNRFYISTISDVIIHLDYTAINGGEPLSGQVKTLNQLKYYHGTLVRNLSSLYPAEWEKFKQAKGKSSELKFKLLTEIFPTCISNPTIDLDDGSSIYIIPTTPDISKMTVKVNNYNWERNSKKIVNPSLTIGSDWNIKINNADISKVEEIMIMVPYKAMINWE